MPYFNLKQVENFILKIMANFNLSKVPNFNLKKVENFILKIMTNFNLWTVPNFNLKKVENFNLKARYSNILNAKLDKGCSGIILELLDGVTSKVPHIKKM